MVLYSSSFFTLELAIFTNQQSIRTVRFQTSLHASVCFSSTVWCIDLVIRNVCCSPTGKSPPDSQLDIKINTVLICELNASLTIFVFSLSIRRMLIG